MARRSGFVRPALRQGQRRKSIWIGSADSTAVTNLAAATAVLAQSFTGAQVSALGAFTIVRTRGVMYTKSDTVAAVEEPFGAMSMAVVDEAARSAGIASLNQPIDDESADQFFVYEQWFGGNWSLAAGAADGRWYVQPFDSKAMRKVEDGQAIVQVVENASASHGVQFILKFRMLIKLA